MSQRKFARKTEQGSARNLRLVPPLKDRPAPKRRRRKWKVGRIRKPKYEQMLALHAYEDALILRALEERFEGRASAMSIHSHEPDRWHRRELARAMSRMFQQRKIYSGKRHWNTGRWSGNPHRVYTLHPPTPTAPPTTKEPDARP